MRLTPPPHVLETVERDYAHMEFMIFGTRPDFGDVMTGIAALEEEISALR